VTDKTFRRTLQLRWWLLKAAELENKSIKHLSKQAETAYCAERWCSRAVPRFWVVSLAAAAAVEPHRTSQITWSTMTTTSTEFHSNNRQKKQTHNRCFSGYWRPHAKGKVHLYSLPCAGPGADTGVQTVSPQVTLSHQSGGRLPLLSARPAVTFPAEECHRLSAGTKLYCLVTEAHGCEQLAQGCYLTAWWPGLELATTESKFWWRSAVQFLRYASWQTDKQTYILITIVCTLPGGKVLTHYGLWPCVVGCCCW